MTVFEIMSMNRHARRRIGKHYGVKIPGIDLSAKDSMQPLRTLSKVFMKPDAKVDSVLNIKV